MTWRRNLVAAVVFAATGLSTIVVVSPYITSPVQEYIAVPWLLVLDLAAAIGIAGSCCAAALIGRPSNAVIGCGMTAAALLADAWIGHGLSPGFQAVGFAAVPLLASTIAFAPAVAGIERSRALIVLTRALLGVGLAAAVASIVTYDPYLDLSCQRDCLQNPLLVANVDSVAVVLRLAESAACVAWCLVAIRDIVRGYRTRVILAATASAVAVSALRVVSLTFASDDPQAPALRVLHAGVASCVLIAGVAVAYELSRPFTARVRLDRLLRDLQAAEEFGLERCLRLAVGDQTLTLAYRHPSDAAVLVDTLGLPVAPGDIEADEHTDLSVAGRGVAVVAHRRGAFSAGALHAVLGAASTLALDNERLRAAALYDLASRREASVRLIELGDREREQIEHNLHDGAQQGLLGVALALQLARLQTPSPGIDNAIAEMQELAATVREIAHGIHPATLAENGLAPALESLLDTTNDVPVALHVDRAIGRLDEAVEISAYELIQEGVSNASAHGARSAQVSVAVVDGGLRVDLTDDGPGGACQAAGGGLEAIADRALAVGGTFTITSPPGGPTILRLLVPLAPARDPSPQPSTDSS
jgi:signal transduction histidine kinase